jgi:alkaline phosphatase D
LRVVIIASWKLTPLNSCPMLTRFDLGNSKSVRCVSCSDSCKMTVHDFGYSSFCCNRHACNRIKRLTKQARTLPAQLEVLVMHSTAHTRFHHLAILICSWALIVASSRQSTCADDLQPPPAGLRVFYTGHSFHMFVPRRVDQLVESAGIEGHKLVGTQGIGGSRVYQHWDLADEKNKAKQALTSGKVDVFTMAAHLTVPDRGITNFTELGLKHNPKLRLLVQASWFPFDVPSPQKRIRKNAERDAMKIEDLQAAIDDWRAKLEAHADELNKQHNRKAVFIIPVGDAVVKLRAMVVDGKYPGVKSQSELFTDSIGHAGPHVQALAAYCNFAAIYRVSPEGLTVRFPGVDDAQHDILQKLAWETVSKYGHSGVASVDKKEPVSRVLFGSCTKQNQPMPIFETIVNQRPELFIFLGDNIYADTTDMEVMRAKYAKLKADTGFAKLMKTCPVLATWDDHDYGANDAGSDYPKRVESQRIFVDFWGDSETSPRRKRAGVYDARVFGPEGKRLQVILLDTRYFRGPLKTGERRVGGPYLPNDDKSITMLGEAQWKWLEQQLRVPAEVRIIASSIQCIAESSGQETWSNLPHERQRLFKLIANTKANGVVIVSGDRHWAELSVAKETTSYPIYEITASSFNQLHARGTPTDNRYRADPTTFHRENFGVINIDWERDDASVKLQVLDIDGKVQIEKLLTLRQLQAQLN